MDKNEVIHIGYIVNSSKIAGGNRMIEAILTGLPRDCFAPYVVCPSEGPMVDLVQSLGIPVEVHELYQPSWREPIQTYRHWRIWSQCMASNHLALIHANGLYSGRSAVLATYTKGIPLLCHVHFPVDKETCQWLFKRIPKPFGFIFCSQELQKNTGAFLKQAYPSSRQWVVHNGVDIYLFAPSPISNSILRIGIIGNLQPRKGHEDFLEMAALITKEGKEAQYDIIGGDIEGEGRLEFLQAYARNLGIAEYVHFHGQVNQVVDLLGQLDIVVCASHVEAFPVSILETMACGKPIVATNVNAIPEAVEDQKTGFLVPPHKPQALANAVARLLNDEKLRITMGHHGRKRVEQLFSLETYRTGLLEIYHEVLNI